MKHSLETLAASVSSDIALSHEIGIHVDGFHATVRTNSARLTERLRDYFRSSDGAPTPGTLEILALQAPPPELRLDFLDWQRDPGKQGRKEAYCDLPDGRVILKVRTGMQFFVGATVRLAIGDCEANDNQVINFVIAQYIGWLSSRGAALCHSAGITHAGRGLTIAARSGAGKSTLSLRLMSRGATFVSNDRVLITAIDGEARMHGVPKQPRVNPGTLLNNPDLTRVLEPQRIEQLRRMPIDALWDLEEKYDVDVERIYGPGRWQLSCPLDAVLVLNWSRKESAPATFRQVDLRERRDLLELIMKGPGPFHRGDDGVFSRDDAAPDPEPYLANTAMVPCYEAIGRVDFEAAADFCLRLLER